jgi:branched-chain amino acid transport system substrate-binding protein
VAGCGSSKGTAASSSSAGPKLTKSEIVLGNIGTYSGAFGAQYVESLKGLQAWAKWTNTHGGLNGHPVKIVSKNDSGNPASALSAAKTLVEGDHAVAIVDAMMPGTDSAIASYVQSKQVPVIGGIPLDANWLTNPYFFATGATPVGFLTAQFSGVKVLGGKELGVMVCQFSACTQGIPLYSQITQKLGIGYAGAQTIDSAAPNYTAQCLTFRKQNVDVLIPELDGPTTTRVVRSCTQQGYEPKLVVASADLDAEALANPAFNDALGVTESPLWFGSDAQSQNWYKAYKQMFPNNTPIGYTTLGWQAGVVAGAALAQAPDTVTSQNVLSGLWAVPANSDFGGWTPPITYPKLKPAVVGPCVWIVQVKNKELTAPKGTKAVCSS